MNQNSIHDYLDGEMPAAERAALKAELEADPEARNTLASLEAVVQEAKNVSGRDDSGAWADKVMAEVMAVGQSEPDSFLRQLTGFLFAPRSLKWNVAALMAGAAVLAAALLLIVPHSHSGPPPHHPAHPSDLESMAAPAGPPDGVAYIKLVLYMPNAQEVSLCGDFNDWKPNQIKLTKAENTDLWTVTLPLSTHQAYQYSFVIDSKKWLADPLAGAYVDDGFGGRNAIIDLRNIW